MIFNKGKKYRTECYGEMHFVGINKLNSNYPIVMNDSTGHLLTFSRSGQYRACPDSDYDLQEVSPAVHMRRNAVVEVWHRGSYSKCLRRFSRYDSEHNLYYCISEGVNTRETSWNCCRLISNDDGEI